jgi:hypothetical protein
MRSNKHSLRRSPVGLSRRCGDRSKERALAPGSGHLRARALGTAWGEPDDGPAGAQRPAGGGVDLHRTGAGERSSPSRRSTCIRGSCIGFSEDMRRRGPDADLAGSGFPPRCRADRGRSGRGSIWSRLEEGLSRSSGCARLDGSSRWRGRSASCRSDLGIEIAR